jgi:hypothetical protein
MEQVIVIQIVCDLAVDLSSTSSSFCSCCCVHLGFGFWLLLLVLLLLLVVVVVVVAVRLPPSPPPILPVVGDSCWTWLGRRCCCCCCCMCCWYPLICCVRCPSEETLLALLTLSGEQREGASDLQSIMESKDPGNEGRKEAKKEEGKEATKKTRAVPGPVPVCVRVP